MSVKFVILLKSRLIFILFYSFWMFVNKNISRMHISKRKRCFSGKSSTFYFLVKTTALADFQICISVPISLSKSFTETIFCYNAEIRIDLWQYICSYLCRISHKKLGFWQFKTFADFNSSGKQSDPGHFSKSLGKFFLSFLYTLFVIFLRPKKLQIETLKSFLGCSIFHYS